MTPTHTDTPLRRSEVGAVRTPAQTPVINDDEAERREARRRTAFEQSSTGSSTPSSTTIEDNEQLKNCLKIYQENKLCKENAWSVSVIDTLSRLLDKHHKSLNNFKVAGSSLEASSKVYGLRVDAVHTDVLRMSSGLNKQKFTEDDRDDDNDQDGNRGQQENGEGNRDENQNHDQPKKRKKRVRKNVSTITRNKETINGHLDTNPFTDPIFAKLNSIAGSINSSNRLLQNILQSSDSELGLRMDKQFWNSIERDAITYSDEYDYDDCETVDGRAAQNVILNGCVFRASNSGYIISDSPAEGEESPAAADKEIEEQNNSKMAVAFDMNADVEPLPPDTQMFVDVDMGELDELTAEEQTAINNCRGLRRTAIIIEDLRPIDSSSSNLEYSYRPLDKISQFWAGPSHWKFKKSRGKSFSVGQRFSSQQQYQSNNSDGIKTQNQKARRKPLKLRTQHVNFGEIHDDLFQQLDEKNKMRKANIQKKWDMKKLKLPTDLQIDRDVFNQFLYAPGIRVEEEIEGTLSPDIATECEYNDCGHQADEDDDYCGNAQIDSATVDQNDCISQDEDGLPNQTVVEINSEYIGAPDKVTKIIVPFARRAKVIDMKQLKRCCKDIIAEQLAMTENENIVIDISNEFKGEKYKKGVATFSKIYKTLPQKLTSNQSEALSTSVAFYSILHVANENNLRLLPQADLKDFQILQIDTNND